VSAARQLPAADPFAEQLATEAERLAMLDAADIAARVAHAADVAWVTRDRDVALAALDVLTQTLAALTTATDDPAERAQNAARLRRQALDAGAEALRKREVDHG
jgi:hypothetical protein